MMSNQSITVTSPPAAKFDAADAKILTLLLCAVVAISLAVPAITGGLFDTLSTDDAMRLVEVRDLIGGQGWFDLAQHRLNPPGSLMHWSRVVDAPIAATILTLRPIAGPAYAEAIVLVLWPMLMLIATMFLVSAIAQRLFDGIDVRTVKLIAVLLAALSVPSLIHYRTGAIDHHNVQIALLLCFLFAAAGIEGSRINAAIAGASATLSLAIGLEMLPAIAAGCLAMVGLFIWRGERLRRQAFTLGAALTVCSMLLTILLVPPGSLGAPVCDAFGGPVLLLVAGSGVSLMIVASLDVAWPTIGARVAAGLGSEAILLGTFLTLFPGCMGSPYAAVDPLVSSFWLDRVAESMSFATVLQLEPQKIPAYFGFPVLTLVVAAVAMMRAPAHRRSRFVIPIVTLAALFGISVWQIRGVAAATVVAAPIFAACLVMLLPGRDRARNLLFAAVVASPATLAAAGLAARPVINWIYQPPWTIAEHTAVSSCRAISTMAPLEKLAPGRVMAPIDLGPAILAATKHSVFAAPYHRNNDGNLAMIHTMLGAPQAVRDILRDRKVDYIVMCAGGYEQIEFSQQAPDGLAARLNRGEVPDFLQPLDLGPSSKLVAWRVEIPR
jgi:hypothetical protein